MFIIILIINKKAVRNCYKGNLIDSIVRNKKIRLVITDVSIFRNESRETKLIICLSYIHYHTILKRLFKISFLRLYVKLKLILKLY